MIKLWLGLSSDVRIIFLDTVIDSMHKMSAYSFGNHLEQILWHDQFSPREKWECKKMLSVCKNSRHRQFWYFLLCHIGNKLCLCKYFEFLTMITPSFVCICRSLFSHKSTFFFCYKKSGKKRIQNVYISRAWFEKNRLFSRILNFNCRARANHHFHDPQSDHDHLEKCDPLIWIIFSHLNSKL